MNMFRLGLANLASSPLVTSVNILLLSLGTASIAILLIATHQLSSTLTRDAADIDLVIGAKGSPLQLVLAGVYHADVPPGNIRLAEVETWIEHPLVKSATPLALGDNYAGYRIVGTTDDYVNIYGGKLASGELPEEPLELIVGSIVAEDAGLRLGTTFSGQHGLEGDGHAHDEDRYEVVGILKPTGTILDRLLVTSIESVWALHGVSPPNEKRSGAGKGSESTNRDDHDEHDEDDEHDEQDEQSSQVDSHSADQEITLLLVKYASPIAALTLPRQINAESKLQAASPAFEISRLLQIVGVGIGWLQAFVLILLISAALSIFAALYSSLAARRHELAVLRCLGATRLELLLLLIFEGFALTLAGVMLGLLAAHGGLEIAGRWLIDEQSLVVTGLVWAPAEASLVAGLLVAGLLTSLVPAGQAFATDVAKTLSKP